MAKERSEARRYYSSVLAQARSATWKFIREPQGFGTGALIVLLSPLVYWLRHLHEPEALAKVTGWVLSVGIPVVVAFGLVLFWNLARAPYVLAQRVQSDFAALREQLEQEVHALRSEQRGRETRLHVRETLVELFAEGEQLYNTVHQDATPGYSGSMIGIPHYSDKDWGPEFWSWSGQVEASLREHLGSPYVTQFKSRLGLPSGPHLQGLAVGTAQVGTLNSLWWRLKRLEQIIQGLPDA